MTVVPSHAIEWSSQTASAPQSLDDQIAGFEQRITDATRNGRLTRQQGSDLSKALDDIQQRIEQSASSDNPSTADLRGIAHALHALGRVLARSQQATARGTEVTKTHLAGANPGAAGLDVVA
jgi:hypothetical protein